MKRRFALALAVVMLAALCLSGCGGSAQTGEDSQSSSSAGGETTGSGNHVSDYGTVCWKTDETRWSDFNSLIELRQRA